MRRWDICGERRSLPGWRGGFARARIWAGARRVYLKRVAAYWVRTLVPKRYGGKGLVARPSSPLGQGMRVTANGHQTEPGMNSLIVPPVARVVLPCSVNERLRSAGQFKGGVSGTPAVVPANAKGGSVPRLRGWGGRGRWECTSDG